MLRHMKQHPLVCLPPRILQGDSVSVSVWTSTLKRTNLTARNIPFPKLRYDHLIGTLEVGPGFLKHRTGTPLCCRKGD